MSAADFAKYARALSQAARRAGLRAPGYRSPPGLVGVDRTVRRRPGSTAVVAVRRRGRPAMAVLADMVEGVVVVGGLHHPESDRVRNLLWHEVAHVAGAGRDRTRGEAPTATPQAA